MTCNMLHLTQKIEAVGFWLKIMSENKIKSDWEPESCINPKKVPLQEGPTVIVFHHIEEITENMD